MRQTCVVCTGQSLGRTTEDVGLCAEHLMNPGRNSRFRIKLILREAERGREAQGAGLFPCICCPAWDRKGWP